MTHIRRRLKTICRDSSLLISAAQVLTSVCLPARRLKATFAFQRARTCTSETETEFGSFAEDLYGSALDDAVF